MVRPKYSELTSSVSADDDVSDMNALEVEGSNEEDEDFTEYPSTKVKLKPPNVLFYDYFQTAQFSAGDEDEPIDINTVGEPPTGKLPMKRMTKGVYIGAASNLLNLIVGTGIIGLPFAIRQCTLTLGVILLVFVAISADYTSRLLVRLSLDAKVVGYEQLARKSYGLPGFYMMSICAFNFEFGAMIAFTVVVGDTIPVVICQYFPNMFLADREICTLLIGVFLILPLCLLKDMRHLAFASFLSSCVVCLLVSVVISRGWMHYKGKTPIDGRENDPLTIFSGIGTMCFAFVMHDGVHAVANSMKPNLTNDTWRVVSNAGFGLAFLFSGTFGIMGYLIFFDDTVGNVLNNFDSDDPYINVARMCLGITMVFTIPVANFIGRDYMYTMLFPNSDRDKMTWPWRIILTFILWGSCLTLGIVVQDLGLVLELTGTLAASAVGFILPALFAFKIYGFSYHQKHPLLLIWHTMIFLLGFLSFCIGSIVTMINA